MFDHQNVENQMKSSLKANPKKEAVFFIKYLNKTGISQA